MTLLWKRRLSPAYALLLVPCFCSIICSCLGFSVASSNPNPQQQQSHSRWSNTCKKSSQNSDDNIDQIPETVQRQEQRQQPSSEKPVIPITVLSGFLGSGKTTLLQHLLENDLGLKIAIVVNDVASVNIDGRLIANQDKAAGMVELQNGCACCSKSEEFLASLAELVTLSDIKVRDINNNDNNGETSDSGNNLNYFDHIVVELSGIADPRAIRSQWQQAQMYQMPLTKRVRLDTLVTMVDCSSFLELLQSDKGASPQDSPELFYPPQQDDGEEFFADDDIIIGEDADDDDESALYELSSLLLHRGSFFNTGEDDDDSVAGLLVAQIETADIVLLNKIDLLPSSSSSSSSTELDRIRELVKAFTAGRAEIRKTTYGQVPILDLLGMAGGKGVAMAGLVDDHHDAIQGASAVLNNQENEMSMMQGELLNGRGHHESSSQNHGDHHSHHTLSCDDPDCTDPSHDHDHSHQHGVHVHDHSHDHDHNCDNPHCTDPSHDHDHHHVHNCDDPDCTDPSHDHNHQHQPQPQHAGIGTFVYRARRPFHPTRLLSFLRYLDISRGIPAPQGDQNLLSERMESANGNDRRGHDENQNTVDDCLELSPETRKTLKQRVLRSKGFSWLANSNRAALYWSQVGKSFEFNIFGSWWATVPREKWPPPLVASILQDFDDANHQEEEQQAQAQPQPQSISTTTTAVRTTVGDRRQDIVLIGPGLGNPKEQIELSGALDQCLLTDAEWDTFLSNRWNEYQLQKIFPSPILAKPVDY